MYEPGDRSGLRMGQIFGSTHRGMRVQCGTERGARTMAECIVLAKSVTLLRLSPTHVSTTPAPSLGHYWYRNATASLPFLFCIYTGWQLTWSARQCLDWVIAFSLINALSIKNRWLSTQQMLFGKQYTTVRWQFGYKISELRADHA